MGKAYAVRWQNGAWEMCDADVSEETSQQVTLAEARPGALAAFGNRRTHPPASIARTPADAVARRLVDEKAVAARMVDDIAQQHERIAKLAVLGGRIARGDS